MRVRVTNHAVDRYREKAETDDFLSYRSIDEVREIIRSGLKNSKHTRRIEMLNFFSKRWDLVLPVELYDKQGNYIGYYGVAVKPGKTSEVHITTFFPIHPSDYNTVHSISLLKRASKAFIEEKRKEKLEQKAEAA